ncbi:MAG: chemotaxis protein CheW [Vulcanimicrobiaceae bacterium]
MSNDEPLLVFRVGSYEYGIPVTEMREIARVGELRSIPGAGAGIVGFTSLRGRLMPVLDLRERLGLPHPEPAKGARVVVGNVRGELAAIVTDEVSEVVTVPKTAIESVPAMWVGAASNEVRGVAHIGERRIFILALNRLLKD